MDQQVAEEVASTKFGCAKCGNVYKWKKSLNKHWKEKHGSDPGDQLYTPPGMHILLQQGNHTQTEHRRCCHKNLLERITVKQRGADSNASSRAQTPQNFLNGHYNNGQQDDEMDGAAPLSYMPSTIPMGPFVLGTSSQPVFPSSGQRQSLINSLNAPIPSSTALDLSTHSMDEPDSVDDTPKPLDFSVQRGSQQTNSGSTPASRSLFNSHQEATTEEDEEVSALNQLVASGENLRDKVILKCPKCSEVLKTQTAYSNHMAMHLQSSNKRVAKCGVCQMHFPNNEALNTHFMDNHLDLIASHKVSFWGFTLPPFWGVTVHSPDLDPFLHIVFVLFRCFWFFAHFNLKTTTVLFFLVCAFYAAWSMLSAFLCYTLLRFHCFFVVGFTAS